LFWCVGFLYCGVLVGVWRAVLYFAFAFHGVLLLLGSQGIQTGDSDDGGWWMVGDDDMWNEVKIRYVATMKLLARINVQAADEECCYDL